MAGETVRISAIGVHVPAAREANEGSLARFGVTAEFLHDKLGIFHRAVKAPADQPSDLCVLAAEDLLSQQPIDLADIDLLCVVTQNPDQKIPHTAAKVHERLGLAKHCMTFDISQGCAGYVHGLAIVSALMDRLGLHSALLCTCDPYSTIVDPDDRNTALIFGDAAAVTLLSRQGPGYRMRDASFGTAPGTTSCLSCTDGPLHMDGTAVLMNATREVPENIRELVIKQGLTLDEMGLFLLHPGSLRVIDIIRRKLDVSPERLPFEAAEYGNTVSSSIPLMLKSRLRDLAHDRVILSGFGVGFSWGTCLLERCA